MLNKMTNGRKKMEDKNYGGYGHLLDTKQKAEVDKTRESVSYINQNIKLVKKINNVNHDYETLRRRATLSRAYKAKKQQVETERNVGMAELNKSYKRSMRERITESCVWIFIGVLIALWLH